MICEERIVISFHAVHLVTSSTVPSIIHSWVGKKSNEIAKIVVLFSTSFYILVLFHYLLVGQNASSIAGYSSFHSSQYNRSPHICDPEKRTIVPSYTGTAACTHKRFIYYRKQESGPRASPRSVNRLSNVTWNLVTVNLIIDILYDNWYNTDLRIYGMISMFNLEV